MERQHLKQRKCETIQNFTKEFRKQALVLNVSVDPSETLMKYMGSLHSYLCHSFLLFEPKSIDECSVKVVHLETSEKHEQDDCPKRAATTKRR